MYLSANWYWHLYKLPLFVTLSLASGCGGDSDSAGDGSGVITQNTEGLNAASILISAYPTGLALSVFPQSLEEGSTQLLAEKAHDKKSVKEKIEEQEARIKGASDSCLPSIFSGPPEAAENQCYEFDQDMIYSETQEDGFTRIKGTRNGKDGNGEACMVSFARAQLTDVVNKVDQATGFAEAMLCQATKNGTVAGLPDVGKSVNLTSDLTTAMGARASVSSATIERLEDLDNRAIYKTTITATIKDDSKLTLNLVHSPGTDGSNETFNGTLWTVREGNNGSDKNRIMSIVYARTLESDGTPRIKYELRAARMNEDLASSAFTDAGVVDLNYNADFSVDATDSNYGGHKKPNGEYYEQSNDALEGVTYVVFDINPDTNAGSLAYWQNPGGKYKEVTRGMNFSAQVDATTNLLMGCSTSGASSSHSDGYSIRRALKEESTLSPSRYWHPFLKTENSGQNFPNGVTTGSDANGSFWTGSGSGMNANGQSTTRTETWWLPKIADTTLATDFVTQTGGSITTRQCFKQNADSGLYEIDTSVITEDAGYELLDGGNAEDVAKIIAPPAKSDIKRFSRRVRP